MLKVRDKWFRSMVILLPFLLIVYTGGLLANITVTKIATTLVWLGNLILISEGNRYLIYGSRRWFPVKFRRPLLFLTGVLATSLLLVAGILLRKFIASGKWDASVMMDSMIMINDKKVVTGIWGFSLLNGIVYFSILLLGFEVLYRQAQFRYTEKEKERLEKEKLKAELMQLKGIVNPHFLFNNLNSLSSLIVEDPVQAQAFLDELTKVFRYLLRNNQLELTSLSEELKFIQTYYQLLRTRYGTGISMTLQIDRSYEDLLLPPLTLQLLIENAVKHNRVQKDKPLHIELLGAPGKKLVVQNNICKKEGRVESTGIGLQNINTRYRMLDQTGLVIEQNAERFAVIIPLLEGG